MRTGLHEVVVCENCNKITLFVSTVASKSEIRAPAVPHRCNLSETLELESSPVGRIEQGL